MSFNADTTIITVRTTKYCQSEPTQPTEPLSVHSLILLSPQRNVHPGWNSFIHSRNIILHRLPLSPVHFLFCFLYIMQWKNTGSRIRVGGTREDRHAGQFNSRKRKRFCEWHWHHHRFWKRNAFARPRVHFACLQFFKLLWLPHSQLPGGRKTSGWQKE